MEKELNIEELEKNILSLKSINFQSFAIHHLANFSNFFHNLGSHNFELEKQFGKRIDIRTVAPQSFVMINSLIYEYMHPESKFHLDIIQLQLPINDYLNDSPLPASYNKKCTYKSMAITFNLPIETIRRHCKPWFDSNIMLKNRERGIYTNLDLLMNSNLFKQTHFQIAQTMVESWKLLISNVNDLDFIKNKIYFNPRSIALTQTTSKQKYIKIIVNLNFFWFRALMHLKLSPLSFFELCVLSASLYFKNRKTTLYTYEKDFDYYKNEILLPTNINSISNVTLIPRETTRRTVHKLIKKGILMKKKNLIFINSSVLDGSIKIPKKFKEAVIKDAMVVLKTFNEALT